MKKSIAQYQFEDSVKGINAIWVGHLLIVFLFIASGLNWFYNSPHFWFSLFTALVFIGRKTFYSWSDHKINLTLIAVYLIGCILELVAFGMPASLLAGGQFGGKGFMLDLMAAMFPIIYIGIRFVLVIPLIQLVVRQKQHLANLSA